MERYSGHKKEWHARCYQEQYVCRCGHCTSTSLVRWAKKTRNEELWRWNPHSGDNAIHDWLMASSKSAFVDFPSHTKSDNKSSSSQSNNIFISTVFMWKKPKDSKTCKIEKYYTLQEKYKMNYIRESLNHLLSTSSIWLMYGVISSIAFETPHGRLVLRQYRSISIPSSEKSHQMIPQLLGHTLQIDQISLTFSLHKFLHAFYFTGHENPLPNPTRNFLTKHPKRKLKNFSSDSSFL